VTASLTVQTTTKSCTRIMDDQENMTPFKELNKIPVTNLREIDIQKLYDKNSLLFCYDCRKYVE
jgi:hypothetical protein